MFTRKLSFALAALAGAAVLEGGVAVWALNVANEHVLRGRVASDLRQGFDELTINKLRLRAWFTQAKLSTGADTEQRDKYLAGMRQNLHQLHILSAHAIALSQGEAATLSEHVQREEALAVLEESVATLEVSASNVTPMSAGTDASMAWRVASDLFDSSRGRDLRRLLADSMERELAAVARERKGADQALLWMRRLWLGVAVSIALLALLLAIRFARALRQPMNALTEGAQALQQGNLAHRIRWQGADEFAAVANSMNAMAMELQTHRQREAQARQQLESLVKARTEDLQNALEALQKVDTRRRQLFADISHELRTPTTVILGEAEITLRGPQRDPVEYRDALRRIVSTARQLGAVIDDLLTVARSDMDVLALNRTPLKLSEFLKEVLQQAAAIAHGHGVEVRALESVDADQDILADPLRLRQLLLLLLDNAIRYSHQGGRVTLSVQVVPAEPAYCIISIADAGIGIAAEDLPRVFERSFRSQSARQHRAQGSGLGLSIGRVLARAHGGDIMLESTPGQGATARLTLPLLPADEAGQEI
nr:HAMP domain-containing sensor histidine kinase [uncultured Rhodoferax sp.]